VFIPDEQRYILNNGRGIVNMKPPEIADASDLVPWREAYPEYSEADLRGASLRGSRYKEGLTQKQLADMIGVPQRHISMMENNKRPIGKEMAKRLGKALKISYKVFL
jgi:DNA-binding XRE family transcriptional regulator